MRGERVEWLWVGRRVHAFRDGQSYFAVCGARQGNYAEGAGKSTNQCKRCRKSLGMLP